MQVLTSQNLTQLLKEQRKLQKDIKDQNETLSKLKQNYEADCQKLLKAYDEKVAEIKQVIATQEAELKQNQKDVMNKLSSLQPFPMPN
jgi:predicted  nucleic acid-binding Zn-ribbon protein